MRQRTLLLTGGSSGIGKAAAMYFATKGWKVYELSRSGKDSSLVRHIDCDVTDNDSVRAAVEAVWGEVEELDVLLSNAGYGISGSVEFTDMADVQRQFDVNVFGAVRLIQAVLPRLREQRHGRILFLSSVAAELSIPYQSFYSATKASLNAIALALQNEVRSFGIRVSVLMPGDVRTGFTAARTKNEKGQQVYTHIVRSVASMEKDEQMGMSTEQIARKLYRMATTTCLRPQYVGGLKYQFFMFLNWLLPKRLVNWIVGKLYS